MTQQSALTDEERRSQIKETKGSWASEEGEMKDSVETERKMKVQERRRETVRECPLLVQCSARVSCKNPIPSDLADSVTMRTAAGLL